MKFVSTTLRRKTIGRRFSRAYWNLLKETGKIDEGEQDIKIFKILISDPQWLALSRQGFCNDSIINSLTARLGPYCSPWGARLLNLLNRRHRLDLLPDIVEDLMTFIDDFRNRLPVRLESARTIPQDEELNRLLETTLKKTPIIKTELKPHLIAGCRLLLNDRIYDASVRRFLNEFRKRVERHAL